MVALDLSLGTGDEPLHQEHDASRRQARPHLAQRAGGLDAQRFRVTSNRRPLVFSSHPRLQHEGELEVGWRGIAGGVEQTSWRYRQAEALCEHLEACFVHEVFYERTRRNHETEMVLQPLPLARYEEDVAILVVKEHRCLSLRHRKAF